MFWKLSLVVEKFFRLWRISHLRFCLFRLLFLYQVGHRRIRSNFVIFLLHAYDGSDFLAPYGNNWILCSLLFYQKDLCCCQDRLMKQYYYYYNDDYCVYILGLNHVYFVPNIFFFYVFFLVRYILMYSFYYYAIYIMQIRDECMWILKKNLLKNIQWNKKKIRSRNSNLYSLISFNIILLMLNIPLYLICNIKKCAYNSKWNGKKIYYLILFNIQLLSIITHIGFSLFPSPNCYILSILKIYE